MSQWQVLTREGILSAHCYRPDAHTRCDHANTAMASKCNGLKRANFTSEVGIQASPGFLLTHNTYS